MAISNEIGIYVMPSLPIGSYKISITAQGFSTLIFENKEVAADSTTTVDATMQIGLTDQITVTASKYEEDVINAPASVTVISEQTIQAASTQNVADLLRSAPGMNVAQMSAASFGVTNRGASGAQTINQLILVDGRTLYSDISGATSWEFSTANPSDIRQIEVIRGPASAIWGSYAMNGVVNIITKTPREMIGTTFTLGAGALDRSGGGAQSDTGVLYYARVTHAQALNDRWSFKIAGSAYTQDAFARPQGTVPNDYHTPYPPYTNKGTTQPKGDFRIDYDHPDGKQHFTLEAGGASSSGLYPGGAGGLDVDGTAGHAKMDYSRGSLRITGYVQPGAFSGKMLLLTDPTGQPVRWDGCSTSYHAEFADYRTVAEEHLISYGGNLRYTALGDLSFAPEAKSRIEGGAYIQDEILLSKHFRWVVGARIDKFDNVKGTVVSPRMALVARPRLGHNFRVSYNRAYVAPSVYYTNTQLCFLMPLDLGLIDPTLAGQYYSSPFCFRGSSDLKEQSLNAYEFGYSAKMYNSRVNVGAAFYINDSKGDFIWPQTHSYTSQNPPPGWPLPPAVLDMLISMNAFGPGMGLPLQATTANREGKVRNKGFELNADARFHRHLSGYANYSWQGRPEAKDFDVFSLNLPPSHRFNAGINLDYMRCIGSVSVSYVGRAYWNDIISVIYSGWTKAYTTIDMSAGVRLDEDGKYAVMVRISNLANVRLQNHIYGDILKRQISGELRLRF